MRKIRGERDKDTYQEFQKLLNDKGIVGLFGEIDEMVAMSVISGLIRLDRQKRRTNIVMLIDSPGGFCSDGIAIIDVMRGIRSKIHTVITGEACSMAAYVSLWGNKRSITEHSYWMQHPLQDFLVDYLPYIKDRTKFLSQHEKMFTNMLNKKTKLNNKDIQKALNGELWLDAWQCVEKGVCDNLITKYIYPINRS